MINKMKYSCDSYWQQKSKLEKKLLIVLMCLISVAILWLGVYSPIKNAEINLTTKEHKLEVMIKQINQLAPYAAHFKGSVISEQPIELNESVSISARDANIIIEESQLKEGVMIVSIREVAFDTLNVWLASLEDNHNILVLSIEVTPIKTKQGIVSVKNLQLSRVDV
ncbi:type II secretion system protein GspM [Thorsellia anophelis]|uniref:Type II secretion system (T2SS), protein M n=1 Tax=Thorsellia anophelis DSM 18579 TaxID=1123402 RepID=A0A1I0AUY0_9GAMM|nr:type II secretion system protein GspM [Thorsellia anophelis]SES98174.1 Type II secretion system (T2SS), protein M [Thorsellia anophelis DSM 18579]